MTPSSQLLMKLLHHIIVLRGWWDGAVLCAIHTQNARLREESSILRHFPRKKRTVMSHELAFRDICWDGHVATCHPFSRSLARESCMAGPTGKDTETQSEEPL